MDADLTPDKYRRLLERSLTRLDTDHIDFYHFWGINRDKFDRLILKNNLLETAAKAKDHQGISGVDETALARQWR